jgi:outer membrane protein TolC
VRQAELALEAAQAERQSARGSLLPSLDADGGYEWDRPSIGAASKASWVAGLTLRVNLFAGGGDVKRIEAAGAAERLAEAERDRARGQVQLGARAAWLERRSALERVSVFAAAVAQADESHRLLQARYDAGLASVTDLLRSQDAALDARTRLLAARRELLLAEVALARVRGRLAPDAEVLKR